MHTWPWRRFREMFRRHLARVELEKLERSRDSMIAAINSNPNYDGKEAAEARASRMEHLDHTFAELEKAIRAAARGEAQPTRPEDDAWENDPLFKVYQRGSRNVVSPTMPGEGAGAPLIGA